MSDDDLPTKAREVFGNNLPVEQKETKTVHDEDYDFVKKKLKELLKDSEDVLDEAKSVAVETGAPQSYAAYTKLLETLSNITKGVMDTSKQKADIDKNTNVNSGEPNGYTQNNNIFVGTTKELSDMLKNKDLPVIDND